jgi:hypothetical protein
LSFLAAPLKNNPMLAELLLRFFEFAVRTVVLLGLLWVMIRLQRFNRKYDYRFRKLMLAAAFASVLDMVPYAGHFLAVPVLWVGVKKVTHADYVETLWTIAISYALIFEGGHYLLDPVMKNIQTRIQNTDVREIFRLPRRLKEAMQPTATGTNLQVLQTNLSGLQTNPAQPEAAVSPPNASTNAAPLSPAKPAGRLARYISVKGVTRNAANSAATIQAGTKVYTVFLEEATLMQTPEGPVSVRFAELGTNSVTLEINGEPAKFMVH